nr:MAG TPA: hypothetical protein [Caudoviricetes sp.]
MVKKLKIKFVKFERDSIKVEAVEALIAKGVK